ncbi:MBL fold metallo-hydrolase [Candidatus Parcubacteria bacterium]|nr:hypothetical protein [Patescibacteria group bacterium]MCG2688880.1 MBL fold metallo-hydrolase [Candidatus Parcubacteria bacterium]
MKIVRLIKKSRGVLNGVSFLVNQSIVIDAGFSMKENIGFYSQIKDIGNWVCGQRIPNWKYVPSSFNLFISHAHEDHFAGIYSIPHDKKYNLFTSKQTYKIMVEKSKQLGLAFPKPSKVVFLNNLKEYVFGEITIVPRLVKHNIPGNYLFLISCGGKKIVYSPDYNEPFWRKISLDGGDTLITDFLPELPKYIKGRFDGTKIKRFIHDNRQLIIVDHGWDISFILSILKLAEADEKKIFLSLTIATNLKVVGVRVSKYAVLEKVFINKKKFIIIGDLSDYKTVRDKYPNIASISNNYSLNLMFRNHKKTPFLNVFKGGHLSGQFLKKYLNGKQVKVIKVNYYR